MLGRAGGAGDQPMQRRSEQAVFDSLSNDCKMRKFTQGDGFNGAVDRQLSVLVRLRTHVKPAVRLRLVQVNNTTIRL